VNGNKHYQNFIELVTSKNKLYYGILSCDFGMTFHLFMHAASLPIISIVLQNAFIISIFVTQILHVITPNLQVRCLQT
jgi:hypothetical protein